jgi:hypothetical protein
VQERGLAAGILEEINRDVGKLHSSADAAAPIEGTSTQISQPSS